MKTYYSHAPAFLTVRADDGSVSSRYVEAGQPIVVPDDHKPSITWIPEDAWRPAAIPAPPAEPDTLAERQRAEAASAATRAPAPLEPKQKRASDRDAI